MTDEELIRLASDQETEIAALRKRVAGLEDRIGILHEHMAADGEEAIRLDEELVALRQRVAELERGEYICRKCGLRKDADKAEDADF